MGETEEVEQRLEYLVAWNIQQGGEILRLNKGIRETQLLAAMMFTVNIVLIIAFIILGAKLL